MDAHRLEGAAAARNRLRLAKLLAGAGIVLLLLAYLLGPLFSQRPTAGYEAEINDSYQPFSFFELPKNEQGQPLERSLAAYLSGYHSTPAWRVTLEAPQYPRAAFPDGIPVYFNLTRFTGEVQRMNAINRYIGMEPLEMGAPWERRLAPFIVLVFIVSLGLFIVYDGPGWWVLGMGPALLPVYFLAVFTYWLYWFGHNLQAWGAFTLKPFMPTVLGNGRVAQFTTHSYPDVGFYVLLAVMIVMLLAVFIKRRALNEPRAVPAK